MLSIRFRLLGPVEVVDLDGAPLDIGGRQPRTVVALLALAGGRSVSAGALVDALWPEEPPRAALGTVQTYISRLRRTLGPLGVDIEGDGSGYRLRARTTDGDHLADAVDAVRFEALVADGLGHLAGGRHPRALAVLDEADAAWRGPALADVRDAPALAPDAARLDERRLAAVEARAEAALALGRHGEVAADLAAVAADHPLREQLQALRARALYGAGRQAEALRVLADTGRRLRTELGIEPGRSLRDLEAAVLAQDPSLDEPGPARSDGPPERTPTAEGDGPLVGRRAELDLLRNLLDVAATSNTFAVIEGEPGVGKSRLAEELRVWAGALGAPTARGQGDEHGAAPALWPWLTIVRALADGVGGLAEPVARLLAGAPSRGSSAAAERFEWFEAVADLLGDAGTRHPRPLVVTIDDLQWADPTSLELLAHLAARPGRGVLVVVTVREPEVGRVDALTGALAAIARRPTSRRLRLGGLDADHMAELLRTAPGLGDDTSIIGDRAEGNPFYALELARLLAGGGDPADELPATVRDVVSRRLARLPASTNVLLDIAAVVGREPDIGLVARAADLDPATTSERLEPAVDQRLLVEVPGRVDVVRFGHGLVRDAVLDRLTVLGRARLHLAVADAMEAAGMVVDDAEVVAEHLWRAVPVGVGRRAAEALEHGAVVAVRRGADPVAVRLLERALQLRRRPDGSAADDAAELATVRRLLELHRAAPTGDRAGPIAGGDAATVGLRARLAELEARRHRAPVERPVTR
ncbi:MAG: BTAD domain-containing putative transcriptional regulator [Actinomycetota bacterium]|nr:BTAD domain-containing putative transcriptional regulator [Actinomycetota bacterium]